MCYPRAEFRVGDRDVQLGEVEGTPVYIGGRQFELWHHTRLLIDMCPVAAAASLSKLRWA